MSKRFENWTQNLAIDWCISRQRFFGVPIPVWYKIDEKGKVYFKLQDVFFDNISIVKESENVFKSTYSHYRRRFGWV